MEKQFVQLLNNVKTYCKRILILVVSVSFASAALITANGEAAKNVQPFKQVALSECTQEETYAFGDTQVEDYNTIQNHMLVAAELAQVGEVEPVAAAVEAKSTAVVAQSAQSYQGVAVNPVYADPSMNGYECLGTYLTTGYCPCARCCGKTNGITANGSVAKANHTVAADTGVLPFGTQIVINGKVYTVEDRGGAIRGNRIDIYFTNHQEALNYGKRYVRVYRYVGTSENASAVVVETVSETPDIETTTESTTESVDAGASTATTAVDTTESTAQENTQSTGSDATTATTATEEGSTE